MPSGPPSPTQLQAHRFALRRLESALVGRDPTLRRDTGRRHQRALAVGAALAALVLVGFAVAGVVRGDADWRDADVVRGTPSGALYAVAHDPDRLVPTLNLASARLLAAGAGARESPRAVVVRDDALATAPRTAPAGIVGAPSELPSELPSAPGDDVTSVAGAWSVCDVADLDTTAVPRVESVVLGGVERTGRPLARDEAVLLREGDDTFWLVVEGRRRLVDPRAGALLRGMELSSAVPRQAGAALVAALPEAAPLVAPVVAGTGSPPTDPSTAALGQPVGSVIDAGDGRFFVVGLGGVQEVPAVVARVVRFANPGRGADPRIAQIPAARLVALPRVAVVDPAAYPSSVPRVVGYGGAVAGSPTPPSRAGGTVVCARPSTAPGAPAAVTVSDAVPPITPLPARAGAAAVTGAHVEGAGAYVRTVGAGGDDGRPGGLLVDPGGRAYPVPDERAAAALGLGAPAPAPASVLDLLPRGPTLDPEAARTVR